MSVDADYLGQSGGTLADIGRLVERAARAVGPAGSAFGRVAAAVSVVPLGGRLIPAGGRLLRRHPAGSLLALARLLGALYLIRGLRRLSRLRVGQALAVRCPPAASRAPHAGYSG